MQRLVEVETVSFEEESNEQSLRPSNWDDYIGQEKIKKNLRVFIDASRKRSEALKDTSCCTVFPISTDDDILFIKSFKKLNSPKKPIIIVFISVKFCIRCCWST